MLWVEFPFPFTGCAHILLPVWVSDCYGSAKFQDPNFWTVRPLSDMMIRAAADDVRFLLYVYHKMMKKLNPQSLWYMAVRGALYCRCFCINNNNYEDWPALPKFPGSKISIFLPLNYLL